MQSKPLKNKFVNIDKKDEEAVVNALWRKQLSGTADVVEEFEATLKDTFKTEFMVACSNGTAAIHLALLSLDIKAGDEVIVPPTAPVMTILPVMLSQATPVFADVINDKNFGYDINDLKRKVNKRTKVIITVPMWGYPIEMSQLLDFAKEKNIQVIEDCSQAHGTKIKEKALGTFGDIGLWSAHDRKLIACGEGGFVSTNNKHIYERLLEVRAFGRVIQETNELKDYKGQFGVLFGLNYKINALGAALGITQTNKLGEKIKKRTNNANKIKKGLECIPWINEIPIVQGGVPNYYALVMYIDPNVSTGEYISKKLLDNNIFSDTYEYNYKPLYEMPLFRKYAVECKNAKYLTERIITLPTHEGIDEEDINFMINTIQSIL